MGFFNDFIRGATPAIEGGTNIGLRGMAEAQRKRELQDEIQRQTQQQAFVNMMNQQEMEYGQQRDAIGDQRYAQEYQDNKYFNQQKAVDDFTTNMETFKNNQRDDLRADRLTNAQIGNYKEGRAPSEAEFYWNQMTPEQQQEAVVNYVQNKFKPASGGAGGGSTLTPSNMLSLRGQMMNPLTGGNPETPMSDVTNMAGQIQRTTDSLNTANAGAPMPMQQTAEPQHPAIQKMLQDGITMQMILQDFAQNQQEYEAQGITLEMLQGQ